MTVKWEELNRRRAPVIPDRLFPAPEEYSSFLALLSTVRRSAAARCGAARSSLRGFDTAGAKASGGGGWEGGFESGWNMRCQAVPEVELRISPRPCLPPEAAAARYPSPSAFSPQSKYFATREVPINYYLLKISLDVATLINIGIFSLLSRFSFCQCPRDMPTAKRSTPSPSIPLIPRFFIRVRGFYRPGD